MVTFIVTFKSLLSVLFLSIKGENMGHIVHIIHMHIAEDRKSPKNGETNQSRVLYPLHSLIVSLSCTGCIGLQHVC
jgi:hypothetical protein